MRTVRVFVGAAILLSVTASGSWAQQPVGTILFTPNGVIVGTDGSGTLSVAQLSTSGAGSMFPPTHIPLPRPGAVVACTATLFGVNQVAQAWVLYGDGEVYGYYNGAWAYLGNLFGNQPVATDPATLGRVKATYRR